MCCTLCSKRRDQQRQQAPGPLEARESPAHTESLLAYCYPEFHQALPSMYCPRVKPGANFGGRVVRVPHVPDFKYVLHAVRARVPDYPKVVRSISFTPSIWRCVPSV